MSGYVAYVQYTAGSNKGQTAKGTVFNDPFKLGDVDVNYADAHKAYVEMNFKTELNIEDACRDSWKWQSSNPNGYDKE